MCSPLLAVALLGAAPKHQPGARIQLTGYTLGEVPVSAEVQRDQSQCDRSEASNRVTCLQRDVHLWVEYGPRPLQFHIAGMTNPTLELGTGSQLTVTVANLSLMTLASFYISGDLRPPFRADIGSSASGPWAGFPRRIGRVRYQALPHVMHGTVYTVVMHFQVGQPGVAYYINVFARRAQLGAWGKIVVVP